MGMSSLADHPEVRLRGVSVDDAPAITFLLQGDTELALQTATIPIPYTPDSAHEFVSTADPRYIFTVLAGDQIVGMAGMTEDKEAVEIGYWIGRVYWGLGYATAAVRLLSDEARRRGISRLIAEVFPRNAASMRVLEKNGFVKVGDVHKDLPLRGGLRRLIRFVARLNAAS